MLILPNILMFFDVNRLIDLNEKKAVSKLPKLNGNITVVAKKTRDYYLNNFGYKKASFVIYSFVKTKVLGENPLPNKVVKGKEGWFFLGDFGKNVFSNNAGAKKIKQHEKILVENNIRSFFDKSKHFKVPFYMLVCPDKHQIYNDFLPFSLSNKQSKFEEVLFKFTKKEPRLVLLKNELLKQKKENRIYHKTDTHWNDLGALHGFNALVAKLQSDFPELRKISAANFEAENRVVNRQDLTEMINANIEEEITLFAPKTKKYSQSTSIVDGVKMNRFLNLEKKYKVVIFHDSYSNALMKYFGSTFKESVFVRSYPNYNLLKKEKPDLVILQMVNRKIETLCTKQLF